MAWKKKDKTNLFTRSTKASLKFANQNKKESIDLLTTEYRRVMTIFIPILWPMERIPNLLPKEITDQVETWLSARMKQCAGKQASGIVRGTRAKQKKQLFMIAKLNSEGKFKQARRLQKFYDNTKVSMPEISHIEMELDGRFASIDLNNPTSFDGWLNLGSIGNNIQLKIPFKKTAHFNKLTALGTMTKGVRISKTKLTFIFEIPKPPLKETGTKEGVDVGILSTVTCSDGFQTIKNKHNHDLRTILGRMARKKPGSKAFERCIAHRTNYINWAINQFDLTNIKQLYVEDLRHLRKSRRVSRILERWAFRGIFDKLDSSCEEHGVRINRKDPIYTSQRCSLCGWTRRSNRKGKIFKCGRCGNTMDADLNASRNLALELPEITQKQRLGHPNKQGFYWCALGQEPIVPAVRET